MKAQRMLPLRSLVLLCALALGACGGHEEGGATPENSGGTTAGEDTVTGETDTNQDVFIDPSDGSTPGAGADIDSPKPDTEDDASTEGDGSEQTCGEFGDECTANDQCCDGYCVETFDGLQCTTSCIEECPPGWSCQVVLNSYPDVVTICVPNTSKLCRECTSDLQCNGGSCVQIGPDSDDLFCTVDCSQDACPDGYECVTAENGSQSCRPQNGTCDCSEGNDGAVRPCAAQNDFGVCQGVETCDPAAGWSACSANEPTAEICDGLDNDCDGAADEDFQEPKPCEVTSEFGTCQGVETCQGAGGLVCSASQPSVEMCDFLDNDCDGLTDEDFKTEEGKYGTLEHCGGCGKDCNGLFPNATAKCDDTKVVPQCVVDECDEGYYASGEFQCLPELDTVCQPCTADFQCGGGVCVQVGAGSFCAKQCGAGQDSCSPSFLCQAAAGPDGAPKGQACLPKSGDCGCIPATQGQKKPCQNQNGLGTCFGFQTCEAETGWSTCDALEPGAEICDGVDNDCNGFVDDSLPPTKDCESSVAGVGTCFGTAVCQGTQGWVCNAATPSVELCDFKDNDCDGETDETFKNDAGKYVAQQHCGACGTSCDDAIPNASAECNGDLVTPLCEVDECDTGFYQVNDYLCLQEGASHCKLCTSDAQCDGLTCIGIGDGSYCTEQCTTSSDCPEGYACSELNGQNWCVPPNGTCDCNDTTNGAKKPCEVTNAIGTCVGFETCDPATGWSACSAVEAAVEVCDGFDNDCNGLPDDGLPDTQPCEEQNEFGTCAGTATCAASLGWVCNAQVPSAETCDFLDNDCDGDTDETFVDETGKYAFDDNCGTCGVECGDLIEFSVSESCDPEKPLPQCVVDECAEGYFKINDFQCVVPPDVGCTLCQDDSDCFGGACIELLDGPHCVEPCDDDSDCESGFACNGAHCIPQSGSCDCTEATAGVKKLCSVENDIGACVGFSTCNPESGWSVCDASTPSLEACNGIDDDCNGIPDDGLPASQPCDNSNEFGTCDGEAFCQGAVGWICTASQPGEEQCDFQDNDCDGGVDEDFKDDDGKYASMEHCGTCGQSCGNTVAFSLSETCDTNSAVPKCVATECQPGYFLQNELLCVPNPAVACSPCVADDGCFGGVCKTVGGANYCLDTCTGEADCNDGFSCVDGACEPDNGSCDCTEATAGAQRTCTTQNAVGQCIGLETCDPAVGWTGCTAPIASVEKCDGIDNDCNGLLDDAIPQTQGCFNKNVYGTCEGTATCFGSAGYICNAQEPGPEECDFLDNDCDGGTDEDYKEDGKYTTAAHCGSCNNACGDKIPNSLTELCDASGVVPQCIVDECEEGYLKLNDFQCIEIPAVQCEPCSTDANCFGATCAQVDQGTFCLNQCETPDDCEGDFSCVDGLCRPANGTCDCTDDSAGQKRTCSIANEIGTCFGFETCDPATGWGGCDALPASEEVCNGFDDDCNGFLDDGLPSSIPCQSEPNQFGTCDGVATCFGTVGWFCTAQVAGEELCDFTDNDCDGLTDEGFVDGDGKYVTDQHCGSCNNSCDNAILNGTASCDATKPVPQCVVEECDDGWEKFNDFLCIPITSTLCEPCAGADNCVQEGAECIALNDGFFCGIPCDEASDCPDGYNCQDLGFEESQCIPATGSCDCDGTNLDLQNACEVTFEPNGGGPSQTCFGTEFCTATGWTECILPDELCNGLDDNCNGEADETFKNAEGKYATAAHCGKCNRNCEQLSYANAVGICDVALDEPDCTFQCLPGFYDTNDNPGDGCECEKVGDVDFPNGQDLNCDGIDGELENAIFVAKDGDDANPGTIDEPKLTIQAGIDAAVAGSKRDVYVATSVYSENITLAPGVGVYGGYSADFKQRNTLLYETAIIGVAPSGGQVGTVNAIGINGAGEPTYFDGFTVFGYNADGGGASSYTLYLRNVDERLVISGNRVLAGNGGNGSPGGHGSDGALGTSGADGQGAYDLGVECSALEQFSDGGNAGTQSCGGTDTSGGRGGHGYCPNYSTTSQSSQENGVTGKNGGGAGGSLGYDGIIAPIGGTGGGSGGSCSANECGGNGGGCYCDDLCDFYDDCCTNACSVCGFGCGGPGGGPEPPGAGCSTGNGCTSCLIAPNNLQMVGEDGSDGPAGSTGGSGNACTNAAGSVVNGLWVSASGGNGGSGGHAGGGGGGGAGNGTQTCSCASQMGGADIGGTGGGGGAGGCGGTAGQGGSGAGGSFAVFMVFDNPPSSAPLLENNVVRRGGGGFGGPGGNGGVGGVGGLGGKGGDDGSGATQTFCAGKGGNGGKGGDGGHGGGGGGGCGGASYAFFATGQAGVALDAITSQNSIIAGGAGGNGGAGGLSLGNSGGSGAPGAYDVSNF